MTSKALAQKVADARQALLNQTRQNRKASAELSLSEPNQNALENSSARSPKQSAEGIQIPETKSVDSKTDEIDALISWYNSNKQIIKNTLPTTFKLSGYERITDRDGFLTKLEDYINSKDLPILSNVLPKLKIVIEQLEKNEFDVR